MNHFVLTAEMHGQVIGTIEIRENDHISYLYSVWRNNTGEEASAEDCCKKLWNSVVNIILKSPKSVSIRYPVPFIYMRGWVSIYKNLNG
jgi:hypothetical protein